MEKRLTLDQFKKNVGTQQADLKKLTGGVLGACHPSTTQQAVDNVIGGIKNAWDGIWKP
ncbi:hypothetical protein [Chryseobacterium sp. OV279]|uniref:hypothetical protein n=1 Tax=Chryseobacterium sp. OV279 TaxID=1500285 RepID=UPI000916F590|nr:hypothetical protein [Chryseobacterium sp. OV279]SHF39207.1 hypothetical protein SAMN02787100_1860 [Chryseobacterium sp. OV279]